MSLLKTIIVDDEPDSIALLRIELAKHCPQVEIIASFTSSVKAVNEIEQLQPDLLFLDIEMPTMNGFEMIEKILHADFSIIFITAYSQYALKAFRFSALDYLVKPVDSKDLVEAVARAEKRARPTTEQLSLVQRQLRGELPKKIAIPGNSGISFIDLDDIVYVEASNNYSKILLIDKKISTISKTLKEVQQVLEESHFLRVHRQFIINLNHVKQFNRNESLLTMSNGDHLPIARNQKDRLIEKYGWL